MRDIIAFLFWTKTVKLIICLISIAPIEPDITSDKDTSDK